MEGTIDEKNINTEICLLVAGCSVKRPVLYPNAKLQKVGQAQAQQDIDICCRMAEAYLTNNPIKR